LLNHALEGAIAEIHQLVLPSEYITPCSIQSTRVISSQSRGFCVPVSNAPSARNILIDKDRRCLICTIQ
jgi:hypothetical protein